jgi:hypothetical protein
LLQNKWLRETKKATLIVIPTVLCHPQVVVVSLINVVVVPHIMVDITIKTVISMAATSHLILIVEIAIKVVVDLILIVGVTP